MREQRAPVEKRVADPPPEDPGATIRYHYTAWDLSRGTLVDLAPYQVLAACAEAYRSAAQLEGEKGTTMSRRIAVEHAAKEAARVIADYQTSLNAVPSGSAPEQTP